MKGDKAIIFGSTTRLKLLSCLKQGSKHVSWLIKNCKMSQSSISQHLAKLKSLKLIISQKKGRYVYYQLKKKSLGEIAHQLLIYLKDI